jgi:hypothetical protein
LDSPHILVELSLSLRLYQNREADSLKLERRLSTQDAALLVYIWIGIKQWKFLKTVSGSAPYSQLKKVNDLR